MWTFLLSQENSIMANEGWTTCVLCWCSYFTVSTGAHGQIGFPDLWSLPRAIHFHGYWERDGHRGEDFWGWQQCLTGLRGAVKTKLLINAIDQKKSQMWFAYSPTDQCINRFFFLSLHWNLISWVLKVRERVQTNVDRLGLSQTRIQSILLAVEGWNIAGQKTRSHVGLCIYVSFWQLPCSAFTYFVKLLSTLSHPTSYSEQKTW